MTSTFRYLQLAFDLERLAVVEWKKIKYRKIHAGGLPKDSYAYEVKKDGNIIGYIVYSEYYYKRGIYCPTRFLEEFTLPQQSSFPTRKSATYRLLYPYHKTIGNPYFGGIHIEFITKLGLSSVGDFNKPNSEIIVDGIIHYNNKRHFVQFDLDSNQILHDNVPMNIVNIKEVMQRIKKMITGEEDADERNAP